MNPTIHEIAAAKVADALISASWWQRRAAQMFAAWDEMPADKREIFGPYILHAMADAYERARYWMNVVFHYQDLAR